MNHRAALTCVTGALLFGCGVSTSELRAADTTEIDSDDYSSWFQGISQSEIDDFESQDDADQLAYPTEIPEPDHEPESSSLARAGRRGLARVDAIGSIPYAGDAAVGDGGGSGGGSGSGSGGSCGSVTVAGSVTLGALFAVSVPGQYLGTFGPIRQHNIWASGSASGTANLTLSGSLTATATSWSATIGVSGTANTTVGIHVYQELVGLVRRWFAIGDATLTGTVTFADSVTFTQSCDPRGIVATTPGTPALTVNVVVNDVAFYGFFFPRLQGPVVTRVRGAIAQFARNFANRQLAGLIQPRVFELNQAYASKKMELLGQLVGALPQGCGCAISTN